MPNAVRVLLATLIVLCCVPAGLNGATVTAPDKGAVRVGLLDAHSGYYEPEGQDVDAGFRYFLATHDDELGGFRVEIRTADENGDGALASAQQLVQVDMVDAIVGLVRSSDALLVAGYLADHKTPLVIAGAGADALTQSDAQKNFTRVAHTSSQDDMPLADYLCKRLAKRTAAVVASDGPSGWESAGGFARAYTDAGCRVVQEQYGPEGGDWTPLVAKIDPGAQVVFASVGGIDAVPFLGAFRASGPKTALAGDGVLTDERVLRDEGESALGTVTALHYAATLPTSRNGAFRHGYESLGGGPVSQYVENGYVAAAALSAALAKLPAGPIRSDALAAALREVQFEAPRGTVRFDAFGQVVNDVYIRRVTQVGGRYRNDVIATYHAVSQFWRYDPQRYLQFPPYAKLKGTWVRPKPST
jgi:branched-chain amino acid transport system substrate-binding protein